MAAPGTKPGSLTSLASGKKQLGTARVADNVDRALHEDCEEREAGCSLPAFCVCCQLHILLNILIKVNHLKFNQGKNILIMFSKHTQRERECCDKPNPPVSALANTFANPVSAFPSHPLIGWSLKANPRQLPLHPLVTRHLQLTRTLRSQNSRSASFTPKKKISTNFLTPKNIPSIFKFLRIIFSQIIWIKRDPCILSFKSLLFVNSLPSHFLCH